MCMLHENPISSTLIASKLICSMVLLIDKSVNTLNALFKQSKPQPCPRGYFYPGFSKNSKNQIFNLFGHLNLVLWRQRKNPRLIKDHLQPCASTAPSFLTFSHNFSSAQEHKTPYIFRPLQFLEENLFSSFSYITRTRNLPTNQVFIYLYHKRLFTKEKLISSKENQILRVSCSFFFFFQNLCQ